MHGGTGLPGLKFDFFEGLSPHARGNLRRADGQYETAGPIPACTGEPPPAKMAVIIPRAYPRMHGGTDSVILIAWACWGLSPHARGNPKQG